MAMENYSLSDESLLSYLLSNEQDLFGEMMEEDFQMQELSQCYSNTPNTVPLAPKPINNIQMDELIDKKKSPPYYLNTFVAKKNPHHPSPFATFGQDNKILLALTNKTVRVLNFALSPNKTNGVVVTNQGIYTHTTPSPEKKATIISSLAINSDNLPTEYKKHPICWTSESTFYYGRLKELYLGNIDIKNFVKFKKPFSENICAMASSPEKNYLVVGFGKNIVILDEKTLPIEKKYSDTTNKPIEHIVCSPNGEFIAFTQTDGEIHIINPQGDHLNTLSFPESLTGYIITDNQRLIVAGKNKKRTNKEEIIFLEKDGQELAVWQWDYEIEHIECSPSKQLAITDRENYVLATITKNPSCLIKSLSTKLFNRKKLPQQ